MLRFAALIASLDQSTALGGGRSAATAVQSGERSDRQGDPSLGGGTSIISLINDEEKFPGNAFA